MTEGRSLGLVPRAEAGPGSLTDGSTPRVTIVMTFRERWSLTLRAIESIVAHTPRPFAFWFLDTGMPQALREALLARAVDWDIELLPMPREDLWPVQARKAVAQRIRTPYAVFIDNDVLVTPGWLETLVDCADRTGAGVVGPLYLWGDRESSDLIHMAGGELVIEQDGAQWVMRERHRLMNRRLSEVASELREEPCGFVEFHCMLMRAEVFRAEETFDPGIVCAHEHIHACLVARELGFETWTTPVARVNYLARSPWRLDELGLIRERWSAEALQASLQRFSARWNVIDDERSFGSVRGFVANHREAVDPMSVALQDARIANGPVGRDAIAHSPGGLLMQLRSRGYPEDQVARVARACAVVMRASNGLYRPCGRPFLNHLVGTASVLAYYGCGVRLVLAALMHALHSHEIGTAHEVLIRVQALVAAEPRSAVIARAWADRQGLLERLVRAGVASGAQSVRHVDLLLLEAANDIDMHLSGEVAFSGRRDVPEGALLAQIDATLRALGLAGMADTMALCRQTPVVGFGIVFHRGHGSFQFTPDGTRSGVATRSEGSPVPRA